MLAFNDFFHLSEGQQAFTNTLKFVGGKQVSLEDIEEDEVIHVAKLAEVSVDKAVKLSNAMGMSMANTAYAKKEDRL